MVAAPGAAPDDGRDHSTTAPVGATHSEVITGGDMRKNGNPNMTSSIPTARLASIALAASCGFQREGYSPRYLKIGGRWRDHERWAILAS